MQEQDNNPSSHSLTNEQIARIFGMYWMKPVAWTAEEIGYAQKHDETFWPIAFQVIPELGHVSPWKLLLTPLSSISDEDAIEVAKIFGCNMEDAVKDEDDYKFITRDAEFWRVNLNFWHKTSYEYDEWEIYPLTLYSDGTMSDHYGCCNNAALILQHLIQKGYAVPLFFEPNHPLNGKTAIELNIALDKTKTTDHGQ